MGRSVPVDCYARRQCRGLPYGGVGEAVCRHIYSAIHLIQILRIDVCPTVKPNVDVCASRSSSSYKWRCLEMYFSQDYTALNFVCFDER